MNLSHACRTIAKAGHSGNTSVVIDGLSHESPRARIIALGAAHRLGLLNSANLEPFLADPSHAVRLRATELCAVIPGGPSLAGRLIDSMDDPQLSEMAAFVLGELKLSGPVLDDATRALGAQATTHDDPLCREAAVAALGALESGLEWILAATTDIATVRRRAIIALAPFEGTKVEQALKKALDDRDWQVRQAAEELIGD